MTQSIRSLYIDGAWHSAISDVKIAVINPATLQPIMRVSFGGTEETKEAIQAAKAAFPSWSSLSPRERANYLYRARDILLDKVDFIGRLITKEQGKPLAEAKGEVKGAASFLEWYAEEATRLYGEHIPSSNPAKRLSVIPQPIGVIGAITPWNFPASMITRKIAPALAAGCTVVLKPAPETPLTAIELMKVFHQAGLPKGVVNLVTGDAEKIGAALLESEDVRLLTFTGSTEVGKHLIRGSADTVKKLSLELGGHAPILVFQSADLEKAVNLTIASKFRNSGQTCICANRVFVERKVLNEFQELLVQKVKELKLGDGLESSTTLGPLINGRAYDKVTHHVEEAVSKGATVLYRGDEKDEQLAGYFHPPVVLTSIKEEMLIMNEETFGPVLPIIPFDEEREAIDRANDSPYGLAAYVFTKDLNQSISVSEQLHYGIIGINDVFPATPEAPFGGVKQSGFGKEGGHQGIHEFLDWKYISTSLS
ncbi:succinate-semialdehyde dehdyrogenase [Pontibacillus halophilus JSM 076056 = DSM 19796]|uniref:Succinate-semialdehyde dehdyrogenase n=1 Tax=Pontibacillus halophilus JSM 076056 = DSM 19796 TaxID=1385510 RepID=A0A0A5G984_9BACI|nr:succinate-semialdehyde dehdyrogenase [Pontibacillus halophilus JSM 076056 = DSM 19796]